MESQIFRNLSGRANVKWLGKVLEIPTSRNGGIDLVDDKYGVEIKSRLNTYPQNFAVHSYQISQFEEENPNQTLYWAFLIYGLSKPVKKIKTHNVERLISERKVWLLEWDWIKKLPICDPKTGPYVYIHKKDFIDTKFRRYEASNGILYLPINTPLEERLIVPF